MKSPDSVPAPDADAAAHTLRVQQLFVASQGNVLAFILSLQPKFAEAEDILQETFLVISRKADSFTPGTNFLAWACTVARFKVLEFRRRQATQAAQISDAAVESLCGELPDGAFFEHRLGALRECLHRLAPRARELIWLRYQGACEPEEIARKMAWTPGSVRVALTRARGVLRQCVDARMREATP